MRRPRRAAATPARVAALAAALVLVAGCESMPTSGPVVRAHVPAVVTDEQAPDIEAVPPQPDEAPTDVAEGFLDAMQASPIRLDVARQYLTSTAASEWSPRSSTIVYANKVPPRTVSTAGAATVDVQLTQADRLDATGAWQGPLDAASRDLSLHLVKEDGQYRITNPPDALVVPTSWFSPRYRQASIYFFDPSAQILVPKPVFVPRGGQLASALVASLLAGPGRDLRDVVQTFLPPGLALSLSVPVTSSGVAEVTLSGDPGQLSPTAVPLVLAQLAWTLRQEPGITALRLTVGGTEIALPDGESAYPLDQALEYDPDGYRVSTLPFGLEAGRLVTVHGRQVTRVPGPLDDVHQPLRSVAVDLDSTEVAAVTSRGSEAVVAPLGDAATQDGARVRAVATGATDLLRPAWDFSGRLWLVDADHGHAQVSYVQGGRRHTVDVPGVTGRHVVEFLVSRDATRFLAVVRGRTSDRLVLDRVRIDRSEHVLGFTDPQVLPTSTPAPVRIQGLCWTSPVTVAVATPSVPGQVSEVRTVNLDASPASDEALTSAVPAPVERLIGSPEPGSTPYALTANSLVDLTTGGPVRFEAAVAALGYAG